jgi:hypothetical protein
MRLSFVNDFSHDGNTWTRQDKAPSLAVWHEDHGAVRLLLNGSYTKEHSGLVFRSILKPYEWYKDRPSVTEDRVFELLDQAYVWSEFADGKVKISAGRIKDGSFWFSDGLGMRFDFRPVEGLLFGTTLNVAPAGTGKNITERGDHWKNQLISQGDGISNYALDVLKETSVGIQYNHEKFSINLAFKGDSAADGLEDTDTAGLETRRVTDRADAVANGLKESEAAKGMKAFAGLWLRVIPNVPLEFTATVNNLNGFNDYGWVHVGENISFTGAAPLNITLVAEQDIFGSHAVRTSWGVLHPDPSWTKTDPVTGNPIYNDAPIKFLFLPMVSYPINDRVTVGGGVPIIYWPDNYFEVSADPWVAINLPGAGNISLKYKFMYLQHDKTYRSAEDIKPWINHHVQLKYELNF